VAQTANALKGMVGIAEEFVAEQGTTKIFGLIFYAYSNELLAMRKWKRTKQESTGHGKYGGVRADAEGESENSRNGK
jgi:hypothetical protein